MADEIRIGNPGLPAAEKSAARRITAALLVHAGRPSGSSLDEVRLSQLCQALSAGPDPLRLDELRLQVARGTYLVPALHLSRSIIQEHLPAA